MDSNRNLMQSTIRPRVVAIVMSTTLVAALTVEWGAYQVGVRAEARATAQRKWSNQYCLSCHSDPKMVSLMMYKDDNNGTAALCVGARLPTAAERRAVEAQFNGPAAGVTRGATAPINVPFRVGLK
jgi:hypothetical protein